MKEIVAGTHPASGRHAQRKTGESDISIQTSKPAFRAGADIGGTFTDVILLTPDGSFRSKKVLSTTDDYSRGIVEALLTLTGDAGVDPGDVQQIVHGTTVATNAILEGQGAKTALLTTKGFRDVLELRRLRTPQLYDRFYEPPKPIVDRRLRLEISERIDANGETILELDESSVTVALERIAEEGAEAVAVSLIHSWRSPDHERRVGQLVSERLPDVFLSLSCDVLPEIREYERTSTTVLNAYIGPVVKQYVASLRHRLGSAGVNGDLLIMQSNGGVMTAPAASETPAQIVESGPAAGVIAARGAGVRAGFPDLISFDMGGTTAKASLVEDGEVARTTEYEVGAGISLSARLVKGGGHALKLPVIDIAEVGAGGGSIIWIDRGGALKVGPRSAGAFPGPACHNTGGTDPTVTDANVLLGFVNPEGLAGGAIAVHRDLAEQVIHREVAQPLSLPLLDAAWGAHTVANITMIRAIKAVTTYRGRDPRDFVLMAFGGNGPIHAAGIAASLGIRTVVVPPAPGLFSAVGLLEARLERHFTQSLFGPFVESSLNSIETGFADLEDRATLEVSREASEEESISFRRSLDLRYAGQGFELTIDVDNDTLNNGYFDRVTQSFTIEHERTYGHSATGEPLELVNLRLVAHRVQQSTSPERAVRPSAATVASDRSIYFGASLGMVGTPVLDRDDLESRDRSGPMIIQEYDSTTIIPPRSSARLDEGGNIIVTMANGDA